MPPKFRDDNKYHHTGEREKIRMEYDRYILLHKGGLGCKYKYTLNIWTRRNSTSLASLNLLLTLTSIDDCTFNSYIQFINYDNERIHFLINNYLNHHRCEFKVFCKYFYGLVFHLQEQDVKDEAINIFIEDFESTQQCGTYINTLSHRYNNMFTNDPHRYGFEVQRV